MLYGIKTGKGILCLATDTNVQMGFIRATLKKWAPKISKILTRYLQTDQEGINEELKELFKTDGLGF